MTAEVVNLANHKKGAGGGAGRTRRDFSTRKKGEGGKAGVKRINFHGQNFIGIPEEVRASPVMHALNGNEFRAFLLIGTILSCVLRGDVSKNGEIGITYTQFEKEGIGRHYIAGSIRVLVALGLITVERGMAGADGYRTPSLYGVTMHPAGSRSVADNTWAKIKTVAEAKRIAKAARAEKSDEGHLSFRVYGSGKAEEVA